jgi:hypothetical protein
MSAEDAAAESAASTPSESTASEAAPAPSPAAEPSAPPSTPVTPPSEPGKSAKETVLDAVLKVIPADTTTDALAEAKAAPDAPPPEEGATEAEPDDDDETEPPAEASTPVIRKKIQKLLKKYHNQKKEFQAATQELEAIRPKAAIGAQMETFARENDLSGSDVANLMQIGSFVRKGDYKSFYEAVAPIVRRAQEYLGLALPAQVRDAVQKGQVSEAMARELVRTQMDKQLTERTLATTQQRAAEQNLQTSQDYVLRSVNAVEAQFAAKDPDYKAKSASVLRTAQAMLHERGGTINNAEEAVAIVKAAYDEVNATVRRLQPGVRATPPRPNGNGQQRSARPEPGSPYEAALAGLERARNGAGHP